MKLTAAIHRLKRHARLLAHQKTIPLHQALDSVAANEGFRSWSHLANSWRFRAPAQVVLDKLVPGDLLLLAARPGQGKTVLGLKILAEAAKTGRPTVFFSSEYTERSIRCLLDRSNVDLPSLPRAPVLDLVDCVSAHHVTSQPVLAQAGTVAVIDYLQVMDQRREDPPLGEQIATLKSFACRKKVSLVFLSQVHRSFDPLCKPLPDFDDLRTSNPIDLTLFSKGCFLHDGEMALRPRPKFS